MSYFPHSRWDQESHKRSSRRQPIYQAAIEALESRRLLTAVIGIEAIDATATEASETAAKFRLTRDETDGELEVTIAITGTAVNGTDYDEIEETITFEDGSATADVTITAVDDSTYEGTETVTLEVEEGDDYDVDGDASTDDVSITDNEKPTVSLTSADTTATEGDDDETGTFTLTRDGTEGALAVKVTIAGTATNTTDYDTVATTITIPDGEDHVDVTITTKQDSTLEGTETVKLTLAADTTYNIDSTDKTATVTISDDEKPTVKVVASDSIATEGSTTDTGKFTITRTGTGTAIADTLAVNYVVSGSGTNGTDYDTITTSATIPAGKSSVDVVIKTKTDTSVELTETAILTLASHSAYTIDTSNKAATVTLKDDDKPTVTLTASDATAAETGKSNSGKFTISRTGATTETLAVPVVITGTGTKGADYKSFATTVTIPVGRSSKVIEVKPIDDVALEGSETVILTLGSASTFIASSTKTGTVTISEDEVPDVTIAATDATATEPTTDKGSFTVTRTGPTTAALVVNYTISGTAENGDDMTEIDDNVTIPAGKSSAAISVAPTDDSTLEGTETVILTLDEASTYDLDEDEDTATVNLVDNEKSTVSINAADAAGSEASSATGTFTITRTGSGAAVAAALKVAYTIGGTATNGTDYTTVTGTATIAGGATTKTITITPTDDATLEVAETVILTLASNAAYTVHSTDKSDTVTIAENDKPTVTLVATDASASEAGDKATLTFTRNGPTVEALVVDYSVDDDSTATSTDDFTALSGTVTIAAGMTSATVTVAAVDDSSLEGTEKIIVTTDGDSAYLVDGDKDTATVTVVDNEKPTITLKATDAAMVEDDAEDTATFKFARTGPTTDAVDVFYTVSGFGTAGTDTEETLSGKVTLGVGVSNKTITLTPTDDSAIEGDETIIVTLKAATTYTIDSTDKAGTATITDDERPEVSVVGTDISSKENSTDGVVLTFSRTGATRAALDIDIVASGTAAGADFATAIPSSVTIPAGKSFVTLSLATKNDTTYEGTESLDFLIDDDDSYTIDDDLAEATVSVTDDDLPTIKIEATDASASETGPGTGTFTVSRDDDDPTTDAVTVNLTIGGTTKNGKDYNKIAKTVTIGAGNQSATITITPRTDTVVEGPETVIVTLAKGSYTIDSANATDTVTIADAQKPTISVEAIDSSIDENDAGPAVFRIWRTGQTTAQSLAVSFDLDGTAEVETDYVITNEDGDEITDTITFAAGEAYVDIFIVPVDNDDADGDRTIGLTLATNSAYTIDGDEDSAMMMIADDD